MKNNKDLKSARDEIQRSIDVAQALLGDMARENPLRGPAARMIGFAVSARDLIDRAMIANARPDWLAIVESVGSFALRPPLRARPRPVVGTDPDRDEVFLAEDAGADDADAEDMKKFAADIAEITVALFDLRAGDFRLGGVASETLKEGVAEQLMEGLAL